MDRPVDPVVVTGAEAGGLVGTAPNRIVGFRATAGGWQQIPVQVDERLDTTMAAVYNLPTTQTFYGSSINVPVNVYADPGTFTGPDTDTAFDADDEIAFMARDAGGPRGDLAAPGGTSGSAVEIRLDDPDDADATGYVYLFAGDASLDPGAGQRYVDYQFRLNSGDYKTTYRRTDGPNPEDSTVTTPHYTLHYSDRWTMDRLTHRGGDRPDADLVDRAKYDIQLLCARNENTFNDEEGAFVVNRAGPVRAIRSWVGANSGPNTQNTQVYYDRAFDTVTNLRVHAIPNVGAHIDFSREAYGMTFRNAANPNGVAIDGQPDTLAAGTPSWWTYVGPQGAIGMSATYDVNATALPTTWYEDDTTPTTAQCTGDGEAVGDSGVFFNQWINCTDPGLGCTERLEGRYRVAVAPAGTAPAEVQRLAEHNLRPLTVTVDGEGPPPPDGQCFTATNSQHVEAGRATSWLVFAWAVGSDTYLGTTSATTSLRETSAGVWTRVDAC